MIGSGETQAGSGCGRVRGSARRPDGDERPGSISQVIDDRVREGDLPLVLHGGSGIPVDQVQRAITEGISKVNVNTDLQLVFAAATRKYIESGADKEGKGYDPRKLMKPGRDAIVARTKELIKQFGSDGKGWS